VAGGDTRYPPGDGGGAIASDIHGKNHHVDGTFSAHTERFSILTPALGRLEVSPSLRAPDVFWATAGGMGLTGLVLDATLRCLRVETSRMRVDTERIADLDHLMERMVATEGQYRYSVAWIDCLASGRSLGRSILELGEHARRDELAPKLRSTSRALAFRGGQRVPAPPWAPSGLLNRWTIAAFNELWYRKAPSGRSATSCPSEPTSIPSTWSRTGIASTVPEGSCNTRWWCPTAPKPCCAGPSRSSARHAAPRSWEY